MTKTYTQLMKQIDTLTREAERLRREEIDGVVARIKEAISVYGLTAEDLGLAPKAGRPGRKPRAGVAAKKPRAGRRGERAAKYRDADGNTWGGRGPRPRWLRDAIAAGRKLEEFAV